ncbi:flagellar motor protein MotB [Roseomonas sp. CCTCC AB2023176]|uniref:flagellar motor protein MotB n=1 Tax=Roseomonas sp. CCTCC AB2023176 TaxID=3342640 RepID=UPI0035D935DE
MGVTTAAGQKAGIVAKGKGGKAGGGTTIVLKRIEEAGHGHHGGAWKVAYADFVTAMMAFFLLMWLLNATTEEQRRGLADFFNPTNVMARSQSGSGQPFGGQTPNETVGMASSTGTPRVETGPRPQVMDIEEDETETPAQPLPRRDAPPGPDDEATPARVPSAARTGPGRDARGGDAAQAGAGRSEAEAADIARASDAALRAEVERRERETLERLADQVRAAVRDDPGLADLARQMQVEVTPDGLRIQILDAERQPMFALGGAAPEPRARALLARVGGVINRVPNGVAITGHTDATPFRTGDRTNWDLSADRANATRRLLLEGGVAESRIRGVSGMAAREPLMPEDPTNAANRRVSILLLREHHGGAPGGAPGADRLAPGADRLAPR